MLRTVLSFINLRATVKSAGLRVGTNVFAVIKYVNMRATVKLSSPWYENDNNNNNDGGSVFNTRAINEWTLNG